MMNLKAPEIFAAAALSFVALGFSVAAAFGGAIEDYEFFPPAEDYTGTVTASYTEIGSGPFGETVERSFVKVAGDDGKSYTLSAEDRHFGCYKGDHIAVSESGTSIECDSPED